MTELVKATELSIQEYVASVGLNPDNVFYQRIASNNIGLTQAQWQMTSPNPRAHLLSLGYFHWKPTIQKQTNTGVAENFVNNGVFASFKPCFPFTNAMSNIQTTINSASLSLAQPRRFMDHLSMMFAGRKGAEKCFSSAGGGFPDLDGYHTNAAATRGLVTGYNVIDRTLWKNEESFREKLNRAAGNNDLNGLNSIQIDCIEPIMIPPFNPYYKLKKDMPDYCWFKHMSPVIPHVKNLEISVNFQKLSPSVLLPRYLRGSTDDTKQLAISALAADLILYWYNPPPSMTLPRQITLQTWNVREYITNVGAINNNANAVNYSTDLIQLSSVPSLIVIHAEVDKDHASYSHLAITSDNNQAGDVENPSLNNNALDSYMEISDLQVILGDRPQVISTTFTQEELYYLTLKNSKINDFPYDFQTWRGRRTPAPTAAAARYNQMSKCFVALRPKDISEKFGDGVRNPTTLQFSLNLEARDGLHNLAGGNKSYKLFTHVYSGKHFLTLTPDSGQYQEQQINLNAVASQTQASTGAGLGSGLKKMKLDDSRYQSRMPNF